jgi:hypothetical protein
LYGFLEEAINTIEENNGDFYNLEEARFLVLENITGQNFDDFLRDERTWDDILSVLFQIFYTLRVMNVMGLKHNDLHMGNIFTIEIIPPTPYIFFITDVTYFVFTVTYLVKIIDFDRSNLKGVANTKLNNEEWCIHFGVCNDENPKFDLFTVLKHVYDIVSEEPSTIQSELLLEFCLKCATQELYDTQFPLNGRLCKLVPDPNNGPPVCEGAWTPSDKSLKTVPQILMMDDFVPYRQNLPEFDPRFIPPTPQEMNSSRIYAFPTVPMKNLHQSLTNEKITPIEFID